MRGKYGIYTKKFFHRILNRIFNGAIPVKNSAKLFARKFKVRRNNHITTLKLLQYTLLRKILNKRGKITSLKLSKIQKTFIKFVNGQIKIKIPKYRFVDFRKFLPPKPYKRPHPARQMKRPLVRKEGS
jgi:hypothetical protein